MEPRLTRGQAGCIAGLRDRLNPLWRALALPHRPKELPPQERDWLVRLVHS